MNTVKTLFLVVVSVGLVGCVSQKAHERTMDELNMTAQDSTQEVEQLQHIVEEKEGAVARLQEEKGNLEQTLVSKEAARVQLEEAKVGLEQTVLAKEAVVTQLEETKQDLEHTIEVQEQVKEQQVKDFRKEIEDLYAQVSGFAEMTGNGTLSGGGVFSTEPVDFGDLAQAFQQVRATLQDQMTHWSKLRNQNGQLEKELSALEVRLQGVERLRKELEQVRAAREAEEARYTQLKEELEQVQLAREEQEARIAKVKHEVQTVGQEIDRITKALEGKFGNSLVVTQHQDRLVLTMLGQVLFESGEADLTPLGLKIMRQVGQVLASLPNKNIQVEGHTDNNPIYGRLQRQYPTNWELSTARATTLLRFLVEETNMNPKAFAATGYAETRPVTTNETEEGRAQNRRVEIVLYPERTVQPGEKVATLAPKSSTQ